MNGIEDNGRCTIAILGRNVRPPWNEAVKNMAYELGYQLAALGHNVHLITTNSDGFED